MQFADPGPNMWHASRLYVLYALAALVAAHHTVAESYPGRRLLKSARRRPPLPCLPLERRLHVTRRSHATCLLGDPTAYLVATGVLDMTMRRTCARNRQHLCRPVSRAERRWRLHE